MRDTNSSNKINRFELTKNSSLKLWMERKEKGQNNLTQMKQPLFGVTMWSEEISHNERASWLDEVFKKISTLTWRILKLE